MLDFLHLTLLESFLFPSLLLVFPRDDIGVHPQQFFGHESEVLDKVIANVTSEILIEVGLENLAIH